MSRFMVSDGFAILLSHYTALFATPGDFFTSLIEVFASDRKLAGPCCVDRGVGVREQETV